ncbi:MAG TPA: M15 family metallopeptidase, partial [Thermoanaerobaculia bacterium]
MIAVLALLIAAQTYGPQRLPPVAEEEDPLVDAAPLVPGLIVDLAYARPDNLAGRALYPPDAKCLLRRSVAGRLARAAEALRGQGFRLIARDCTRPDAAQKALWKIHPHPGGVADPSRGSLHARGVA